MQLPAVEAEPDVIQRAYLGAFRWSDKFWEGVFARLPGAKAAKSDGATDFKAVTDALLTGETADNHSWLWMPCLLISCHMTVMMQWSSAFESFHVFILHMPG